MDKIAAQKCSSYDMDTLDAAVETLFTDLDFSKFILKDSKILIKPNLIMKRRPEDATTTHPNVVRAVVRALVRRGASADNITLADSPGGLYSASALKGIYHVCGMADAAQQEGFHLNYNFESETVAFEDGVRCRLFQIIKPVLDADIIVNIPKFKTHAMTGYSGACKNLFGCIPGLIKPEMHCRFPEKPQFGEMLVDLCELIKPQINVIDGVIGMEGNGPTGGNPRFVGVVAAAENPHALDLALSSIIELKPDSITTLKSAISRGFVGSTLSNIEIIGADLDDLQIHDFKRPDSHSVDFVDYLPKFIRKPASKILSPKPVILPKKCIGCGKCAESCPQHTIEIQEKKAHIDYTACIKCFCCHEMCPVKAIDIKRFKMFDL